MTEKISKYCLLAVVGGIIYGIIEISFRGHTHWTMLILGGICFIAIGLINEIIPWEMPFPVQMLIGGIIITSLEFITGCVVNLWLGWDIWDYSDRFGNVLGQICPLFSLVWVFVSAIAIVLDDYLRYLLFDEDKPKYFI